MIQDAPEREVTRTYLQLTTPAQLRPVHGIVDGARVERATGCTPEYYRYLYGAVGRAYHWVDRAAWSDRQLETHLARPGIGIWVLYADGVPAGFFELERHDDGSVEIVYFGLIPRFHRRGLGKRMLTAAVEEAWAMGASRVWLHTCTLDDEAALPNYRKRGFEPYHEERYTVRLTP